MQLRGSSRTRVFRQHRKQPGSIAFDMFDTNMGPVIAYGPADLRTELSHVSYICIRGCKWPLSACLRSWWSDLLQKHVHASGAAAQLRNSSSCTCPLPGKIHFEALLHVAAGLH